MSSNQSLTHFAAGLTVGNVPSDLVKSTDGPGLSGSTYTLNMPPFTGYWSVRHAFFAGTVNSSADPVLTIYSTVRAPTSLLLKTLVSSPADTFIILVTVMTYDTSVTNRARILIEHSVNGSVPAWTYIHDTTNDYTDAADGEVYLALTGVTSTIGLAY